MALLVDLPSGKFSVSVEKIVNLGNFENVRIGLQESFDLSSVSRDDAYKTLYVKVDEWASKLKPAKAPGPVVGVTKTSEVIHTEDPYKDLQERRQSTKKPNLSTILISDETLRNSTIADLFSKLKPVGSLHVLHIA